MDYPFEKEKENVKAFAYSLENLDLSFEGNYVISTGRQIPGGTKSFSSCTTLTSLIKGHARLFFSRKKSSLPSDFHVID